ncbi:MAG: hypothetical protein WAP36_00865 [Halanaerobiales bacterium]
MEPEAKARLEAILARIREIRANLYPADWTADPLYHIEQELESLLSDVKHG